MSTPVSRNRYWDDDVQALRRAIDEDRNLGVRLAAEARVSPYTIYRLRAGKHVRAIRATTLDALLAAYTRLRPREQVEASSERPSTVETIRNMLDVNCHYSARLAAEARISTSTIYRFRNGASLSSRTIQNIITAHERLTPNEKIPACTYVGSPPAVGARAQVGAEDKPATKYSSEIRFGLTPIEDSMARRITAQYSMPMAVVMRSLIRCEYSRLFGQALPDANAASPSHEIYNAPMAPTEPKHNSALWVSKRRHDLVTALREKPGADYGWLAERIYGRDTPAFRLNLASVVFKAHRQGAIEQISPGRYRVKEPL